ncbi:MAG: DUF1775 domain-containing protein [Pseudomonadota bacterium]
MPVLKTLRTAGLSALALSVAPNLALAHATLEVKTAEAGSTYKGVMRIGHGCEGSATHTLEIQLPDGFINAKPMPKAGWTVTTETGAYDKAYDYYGRALTEGVRTIRWIGGPLADAHYDEFVFRGALRDHADGAVLAFPTIQLCEDGRHDWVEIAAPGQDPHDLAGPAPTLVITASAEKSGHHHAAASPVGEAALGDLVIEGAWTREPPPGAPVGGGYMTITNTGDTIDRLIGGSVTFADAFEVHEMSVENGMMRMAEVEGGLKIPPGETVTLQPGGYHVMFVGITDRPVKGDTVDVTLTFETAGTVTVTMRVAAIGASSAGHSHDHNHSGHGAH